MDIDRGQNSTEKFRGGAHWYMMNTKEFSSIVNFNLQNEICFNAQSTR